MVVLNKMFYRKTAILGGVFGDNEVTVHGLRLDKVKIIPPAGTDA